EPAAITVPQGNLPSLDVDLNGQADALSDGIVIIRHLFGFTGNALVDGAIDPAGQRTDPTAITNYLNSIGTALDVDLNQQADALSDGIMIIRSLFGFTGTALTSGAIDPAGQRTDPAVIASFLDNMNPQRELVAPLFTAGLQQDTGLSATDAITFNPTITGTLADLNQIAAFTAGFDGTPVSSFVNVLADLQTTGNFTLSTARMNQLAGGTLADGSHTLHLRATDARGNVATIDRTLTLDTAAPLTPIFDLALTSDTGTLGDQQTAAGIVTLKGQTDPTTSIQLVGPGTNTLSNGTGTFQLPDLALSVGANAFTLRASDVAGNHRDFSRTITRLAATQQADVVLTWNQVMLDAIQRDATPPPVASRGMAMVSLAIYDTINAIEGTPGYYVSLPAQPGSSPDAAAASAAHRVLSYLYPGQQALFDTQLAASLASIPDGAAKTNGIALGQNIANAIIAIRATDGWNDFVDYVPGSQPGEWQLTGPMYDVALLPQWADLTPFALTSPDQFQPAGPPALDSAAYAAALNEVKALGSATGSTRTADQTQIARFWADGGGTYTPPGHWDQIAQQIALQQGNSLSANARLFAELNVALADAGITAWNTKYADSFWRPVTAIQQADLDGNALTTADPTWSSFLMTPPFPEYISGHSTFSGAAAEILTSVFGANVGFTTTSLGLPGVTRTFTSFEQAAQEAGKSRIYGGIHFEFSNQDGLTAGHQLADFVLNRFTVTTDSQGPKILLNQQSGTTTKTNLTLTGQVLDNLSGLASPPAKLDNGAFAQVTFSLTGAFSLPSTLTLDGTADGTHTLTFQATDNQGNVSVMPFTFTLDTTAPTITLGAPIVSDVLTVASRLTGSVSGTGSAITKLTYGFDGGTAMPITIDPLSGIDEPLDLSKLTVGNHTLTVTAMDAAGNVTTTNVAVSLAALIPLTITNMTPTTSSSDVGSTFRPQVFFSRSINPTTLNANNFYATDSTGTKLAATIVPSQDGTFAWLFFTNPMPGGETITLHVDGTTILGATDGQALDADGNGTSGGIFTSTFSTVSLMPIPGTTITGRVFDPGPDLKPMTFDDIRAGADGILHTPDDVFLNPIAHAKVFIVGLESQAVFTDAQGNFTLTNVPGGNVKVAVDGRTATNAPVGIFFPEMVMDATIEPGLPNTLMGSMGTGAEQRANETRGEVYLPRLQTTILQTVSNTQSTVVGVTAKSAPDLTAQEAQNLFLTVPPDSAVGPDGQTIANVQIGISTVPPEMIRSMLPAGLLQLSNTITIQARGPNGEVVDRFTAPIQLTFPNVYAAAPGTKLNFYSFDHTTGKLVIEGTATVSADGLSVTTDPGQGITKPGWHGVTPPGSERKVRPDTSSPPVDSDKDGVPDIHDNDDDNDGVPDKEDTDEQYLVSAGRGGIVNGYFKYSDSFGLDVPLKLFEEIDGVIDTDHIVDTLKKYVIKFEGTIPEKPTDYQVGPEPLTIYVPKWAGDYLIPEIDVRFFDLKFGAEISLALGLTGEFHIDGFKPNSPASNSGQKLYFDKAEFRPFNAELKLFTQLKSAVISHIPFGIGNTLTKEYKRDIHVAGLPTVDFLEKFPDYKKKGLSIPGVSAIDYRDSFNLGAFLSFGAEGRFSPNVYVHKTLVPITASSLADISSADLVRGEPTFDLAPEDLPTISTSLSLTNSGKIYYLYELEDGTTFRGNVRQGQEIAQFLPANSAYNFAVFDPGTNRTYLELGETGPSGLSTTSTAKLSSIGGIDFDSDGISDIGEYVLGTDSESVDSNNDSVSDLSELQQGLDSLGGRGLPTGVVSSLSLKGEAKEVVLEGSTLNVESQTAYVATGSYGLAIVDASQFQKPVVLSQLDMPGDSVDVSVDASLAIAAVASGAGGLNLVNVVTPNQPTLLRNIAFTATQVEVFEGIAYASRGTELRAYDLLTGERLATYVGTATITGLAREGSMLYTMDSGRVLRAIDISTGGLSARGSLTMPNVGGKLFVGNGIAYVAAEAIFTGGFATANVSNPNALVLISGVDATNLAGKALAVNGSGLAVSVGSPGNLGNLIEVLNVSDPANTGVTAFITQYTLPADPFAVSIAAGIAFVADGTGGLQVVNYRAFDNQGQAPTIGITSPVIDLDPITSGIQVQEGTTISIQATLSDDVQVRNVEVLVNGQVVRNEVSFPFDLSAILPTIAQTGSDTVTIQVRATDTGGNATLSNQLTLKLLPDTLAPTITSISPTDGSKRGQAARTVVVNFSEAMDASTLTAANIQLIGPSGAVTPTDIQIRTGGHSAQLTYAPLVPGSYQIVINQATVKDRAGNAIGVGTTSSNFTIALATVVFTNAAGGGFWDVAGNWDGNVLPTATDDVLIDAPGNVTVIYRQGTSEIHSLTSANPLMLSGGTLTVAATVQVNNTFTLAGGTLKDATVLAGSGGQGVIAPANTVSRLDGVVLDANLLVAAGGRVIVSNGLTLNGSLTLTSVSPGTSTLLDFEGADTQTLGGTGRVVFGGTSSGNQVRPITAGGSLVIGPGVVVEGGTGSGTVGSGTLGLLLQGQVRTGIRTITLLGNWTTAGTIDVTGGGTVNLGGTFTTADLDPARLTRNATST
ncbi:MAG: Ig-like domain-containing protein, partial [Nitrospira sp.]